jgi:hypothetical protein
VYVAEVPRPAPRAGEVLVHAAAVTSADARIRGARFPVVRQFGRRRPTLLSGGVLLDGRDNVFRERTQNVSRQSQALDAHARLNARKPIA